MEANNYFGIDGITVVVFMVAVFALIGWVLSMNRQMKLQSLEIERMKREQERQARELEEQRRRDKSSNRFGSAILEILITILVTAILAFLGLK